MHRIRVFLLPAIALAFRLVALPVGPGGHEPLSEPLTRYKIVRLLGERQPSSVENFIATLPDNYKRGFEISVNTSIHRSRNVPSTYPWVVSKGADSRFVFGWGTDPNRSNYESVYWIARIGSDVETGVLDFSGETPVLRENVRCGRCHVRTIEGSELQRPAYRTKAASDDTRDMLLQALSHDPRISMLSTERIEVFPQRDWQPLIGVEWTNKWRGDDTAIPLVSRTTIDVSEFALQRNSDLIAETNSDEVESVRFGIARARPFRAWVVEAGPESPFTLVEESRFFLGHEALYQNGTYYMEVTAFASDGTPSIPLDLRYRIENGASLFGASSRSTGSSSRTPPVVAYEWTECEFDVQQEGGGVPSYWERRDCPARRSVSAYRWEGPTSEGFCFAQAAWSDRTQADRDMNRIVAHVRIPSYDGVCP